MTMLAAISRRIMGFSLSSHTDVRRGGALKSDPEGSAASGPM